jgi:hypothetical protein
MIRALGAVDIFMRIYAVVVIGWAVLDGLRLVNPNFAAPVSRSPWLGAPPNVTPVALGKTTGGAPNARPR